MQVVPVSELTRYLKDLMEEDPYLSDVWVRGELSGYTQAASGHRYFQLKDATAVLKCVMFRTAGLRAPVPALRNGIAVLAHGHISMYDARGEVQLYVDAVEDAGIGLLHLQFEELKARLEAEGLFDESRKRPLPASPTVVGVVTSASGAALRDVLRVLRARCPLVQVLLAPTLVQGDGAARAVAAAIDLLNAHGGPDVIVVARGGGSIEDLWAFNEEPVARAIARSRVPVITGVGHETDFTIADFVADYRASTPTAAASASVPDLAVLADSLVEARARLGLLVRNYLDTARQHLDDAREDLRRASPQARIDDGRERVDDAVRMLSAHMAHRLQLTRERLSRRAAQLHALSPLLTIARGYAVVRTTPDGDLVTSVSRVATGQELSVRVRDGVFAAVAGRRLAWEPDAESSIESSDGATVKPAGSRREATARRERRARLVRADVLADNEGSAHDGN
jgi:exodeoxyribonuclease VII large subunit